MTKRRITQLLTVSFAIHLIGSLNSHAVSLSEALNTTFAVWNTGSTSNLTTWQGQTNVFWRDGAAAGSGSITHRQTNWVETTVFTVTNVSFWWRVSSEEDFDYLKFFVNGNELLAISGETVETNYNIAIPTGTNVLRWAYMKDDSDLFDIGQDKGWVDEVQFSPNFEPSFSIMLSTPVLTNGQVQFTVTNKVGWPCEILYSTNLAANQWMLLLATNTPSTPTVTVTDLVTTNSRAGRFYRAKSP